MEMTYGIDEDGDFRIIFDNDKYRYLPTEISEKDFEDAVLELASKISTRRSSERFNNGNGPIVGDWCAGSVQVETVENFQKMRIVELVENNTRLIGIINKLVEK
jgi:hypothetical protein